MYDRPENLVGTWQQCPVGTLVIHNMRKPETGALKVSLPVPACRQFRTKLWMMKFMMLGNTGISLLGLVIPSQLWRANLLYALVQSFGSKVY